MLALAFIVPAAIVLTALLFLAGTRPSRRLPASVRRELATIPTRSWQSQVVDLQLADGRVIEEVYVAFRKYIALIGGRMHSHRYTASDVVHARHHQGT
jgi:hypothetical protein